MADFVENEKDISEVIEILEQIDLEIEEADNSEIYIERILIGKNINDKLMAANELFVHGIVPNDMGGSRLKEYRGIKVEILEDEGDLDDIDFILGV